MQAIVTGGAGFIGSNLVDALVARGDGVTVIDDLSTGKESNLADALIKGVELRVLDIRDGEQLSAVVEAVRPDVIFHLAAQIDVRKSIAEPAWDASINVQGTINVLEAARRHGVPRVVNSSTGGAIYGEADVIPTPETATPLPEAAYGQSKLAAEGYLGLYERLYGLSSLTLRYGNVYGPRQDPLGEAGVIAIFCGCLYTDRRPTIFGDGSQTRDYVYVGDVVAANLAAASASGAGGQLNIGTARETSVLDLVTMLGELGGAPDFAADFAPARLGELPRSCLDVGRAEALIRWTPSVELKDGLRMTLEAGRALPQR
jgi:UDP-glucose 4-epimerase